MKIAETLIFANAELIQPNKNEEVLVRGWGEKRQHYVWDFAIYEAQIASKRWRTRDGGTLWFEPIEWARLPVAVCET